MDNNKFFWEEDNNNPPENNQSNTDAQQQSQQPQQPQQPQQQAPAEQPHQQASAEAQGNYYYQQDVNAPQGQQKNENEAFAFTPPAAKKKMKKWQRTLIIVCSVVLILSVGAIGAISLGLVQFSTDNGLQITIGAPSGTDSNSSKTDKKVGSYLNISQTPKDSNSSSSSGKLTIAQVAAKVSPSVVGIETQVTDAFSSGTATGSGIIMTSDGYIVTNCHVIEGASSISVVMSDGTRYDAKLVGSDSDSDLAVLKIKATGLVKAEFGDSDALAVGDTAVAIGNPYGLELQGTVTSGIISAVNREITVNDTQTMTLIQTDAAINYGNSGGPLVNIYGQVVGINSLKLSESSAEGLGFAIPINTAKPIVDELITYGFISGKPAIGIQGSVITQDVAQYYNIPQGVYVSSFTSAEPMNSGLKIGDIITSFNGVKITDMATLNTEKDKFTAGDKVKITVYRDDNFYDNKQGKTLSLTITLADEKSTTQTPQLN